MPRMDPTDGAHEWIAGVGPRTLKPKTWRYDAPNVDGAHRLARAAR